MQYSNVENEYLIDLLKSSLKCQSVNNPPENIDWQKFVALAKKQQVYSVIAPALSQVNMPQEQANELALYNQNELLRLIAMKNEQECLEKELEKNEIKYMLLKGGVIKEYYPQQKMRQMSDLDILYDGSKKEELFKIMKDRGYRILSCSENSDDFTKEPFYTFEFHRELFYKEHDFYCDFSNVWENAVKDENSDYKYHMSKEDLYLHSIAHMNKHYKFGGFGIRFLADTFLLLERDWADLDKEYVKKRLEEFGLTEFEEFIRNLSSELFGEGNFNSEQAEFLNTSLNFGIYGNTEGITVYFDEYQNNKGNKVTPFGFYAAKIFPSAEFMKKNYAVLEKKPYLLPAYYIYRLFEKFVHKRKMVIHNYKVLKKYTKEDINGG